MHIDWSSLGLVAVVALVATTVLVALFATGIQALSRRERAAEAGRSDAVATVTAGTSFLLCAAIVLYGIYLIVLG
ncbi:MULTISPECIES: hypothetical protein [Sciscionella]|uniref:hypothetical protein n=1 Tax=Sciscionella TaxID=596495 RepID=UPI00035F4286|nr:MULTISPECIES: hypothetical protein [Sciscionella]